MQSLFKTQLMAILTLASADTAQKTDSEISLEEIVKPSIFDTDASKRIKGMMIEVQEYINEIEYTKVNKAVLEKEIGEAKQNQ